MRPRALVLVLLPALLTGPAALAGLGAASADPTCALAQARLQATLADGVITLPVAHALRDAAIACGDDATGTETDPNPTPQPPRLLTRLPASQCGFVEPVTAESPSGTITTYAFVGTVPHKQVETGESTATYTPAAQHTRYEGYGERYGLLATSDGAATVFVLGVPVPAHGQANSGCASPGGDLCWGDAAAKVLQPGVSITVLGEFNVC